MAKRTLTVAAIQTSYGHDMQAQHRQGRKRFVREAAKRGAQVVLPSELFQGIYFLHAAGPEVVRPPRIPVDEHPCVLALQKLAAELKVVIPISFFEKDGPRYYNSVAIADADGEILGVYRKSHIPDGPGYQEKYYFRPGDTGFKAWKTKAGTHRRRHLLGPVVSRSARAPWRSPAPRCCSIRRRSARSRMTAALDTHQQWQRAMQGHAVANAVPVVAANRIGLEENDGAKQKFYGHSFIADHRGEIVESFGATEEGVLVHTFDLTEIESYRADWGFFRDRRTDLYAKSIV